MQLIMISLFLKLLIIKPSKQSIKQELGIPPDQLVVLCVAGMVYKKHQQDLIRAMAKIKTPARLILVGDGPLMDQVRKICEDELPETILTGFINQSELPRYYAIADIFVLPSLWEEFGLVVNEAMCGGLPVITTCTVAASKDLIIEGENGFTYAPGDVNALAEKLGLLLDDDGMRARFGMRSLEIIKGWNYDRTVKGILDALDYVHGRKSKIIENG